MANPNLTAGYVFQPTGRELIDHYLVPRAGLGGDIFPGFIEEGVDVLSLPPRELPFRENHIRDYGEVWGFFFAAKSAGETCPTPGAGGCWVQYGTEKPYYGSEGGREAVAFRRRFAYRYMWKGGAVWSPARWLMKEYRLNRDATAFRRAHPDPEARDVVFVVHKVYRKPVLPPPADSSSSDSEEEGSERSMVLKRKRS
ncbi:NAC transcription factor NAM-B2-like [Triticum dicoccoides]|uniref:NAC transcription factor NAM-B2-like n=1 Tax=Triticum dicoccoides TaxID=85692 RepID=UPI00189072CA|nr:NAC transcription factor NAM-B2-like [Triticum dicoccoides]